MSCLFSNLMSYLLKKKKKKKKSNLKHGLSTDL